MKHPQFSAIHERWYENAVMYEVYVDKFAGNFKGLAEKIPYLLRLGVTAVWILPHYPSPLIDGGYDVADYRNVRSDLGSLEDFARFVHYAHAADIKIVVDLVLNHTSVQHPWFQQASRSKMNKYRHYYLWSKTGTELKDAANPFVYMKPSNWIKSEETGEFYFATFYPEQADLNWDNPVVFHEMTDIMDFWIGLGVDGFRFDAAPFLIKRENTLSVHLAETHQIIKRLRAHLEEHHPEIVIVGEVNGTQEQIRQYFGYGDECHMLFNFHLAERMFLAIARKDYRFFEEALSNSAGIPDGCAWASFLTNHDDVNLAFANEEIRHELFSFFNPGPYVSRKGTIAALRLAEAFRGRKENIIRAFRLLMAVPGTKIIYYGEEIGMRNMPTDIKYIDKRRYVRGSFDWREAEKQMKDRESLFCAVASMLHRAQGR